MKNFMNCPECGSEMVPDGGINILDGRPVYGGWYCPCALARAERGVSAAMPAHDSSDVFASDDAAAE